jgi:hypothetical protein
MSLPNRLVLYGGSAILATVWIGNFLVQNLSQAFGWQSPPGLQPDALMGTTVGVLIVDFVVFAHQLELNLRASGQAPSAQLLTDQAKTYEAAADLVRNPGVLDQDDKRLDVISYASRRGYNSATSTKRAQDAVEAFDEEICQRIKQEWKVRRLWVVTSEKELDDVIRDFVDRKELSDLSLPYEVRVLVYPQTLPPLQVLIVGRDNVLIGLDSQRAPGVTENGIRFKGESFVNVALEDFESLWELDKAHHVRTRLDGKNTTAIRAARARLEAQPIVTTKIEEINQEALDLVGRADRGTEFLATSLWFYQDADRRHTLQDMYGSKLAERLRCDDSARYKRALAVDSAQTLNLVRQDAEAALTVAQISTRVFHGNPVVMDCLISETEAILAWPQRAGAPNLQMAIILRHPPSVEALRRWYDEFIWDHSIIPNKVVTTAADLAKLPF